jgi:hypothetical protein
MEKVTKSSTNHFTRLNRPLTLRQIAQLCRCTRICTAACTIPAHVRHCCPRRCIPTSFAVRTLDSIRRVWTQQSGEVMNAAECDQGESRNAAKFGGHNIFPMRPEVVVPCSAALARPPTRRPSRPFNLRFTILACFSHTRIIARLLVSSTCYLKSGVPPQCDKMAPTLAGYEGKSAVCIDPCAVSTSHRSLLLCVACLDQL